MKLGYKSVPDTHSDFQSLSIWEVKHKHQCSFLHFSVTLFLELKASMAALRAENVKHNNLASLTRKQWRRVQSKKIQNVLLNLTWRSQNQINIYCNTICLSYYLFYYIKDVWQESISYAITPTALLTQGRSVPWIQVVHEKFWTYHLHVSEGSNVYQTILYCKTSPEAGTEKEQSWVWQPGRNDPLWWTCSIYIKGIWQFTFDS